MVWEFSSLSSNTVLHFILPCPSQNCHIDIVVQCLIKLSKGGKYVTPIPPCHAHAIVSFVKVVHFIWIPLKLKFLMTSVRLSNTIISAELRPFRPFKGSKVTILGIEALTWSSTKTLEYRFLFLRSMIPNQSTSYNVLSSGNFKTWFSPPFDLLSLCMLKKANDINKKRIL